MKKALLGTTALVAAGLVAQDARAADPISLSLGGGQTWGLSFADYDDPAFDEGGASARDDLSIHTSTKIKFKGATVLDNGLEVAVNFELEGESKPGNQMDETWTQVEGSFGAIRIGNEDPASYQMATAAPYASYVFGLNTATFAIGGSPTLSTFPGVNIGNSASLMYFSPVFNGFQFGVSFAPEAGREVNESTGNGGAQPEGGEAWSVAARYDGDMGGVGVTATAGMVSWEVEAVMGTAGREARAATPGTPAMPARDAVYGLYRHGDNDIREYTVSEVDGSDVAMRGEDGQGETNLGGNQGRYRIGDAVYEDDGTLTNNYPLTDVHFNAIILPAQPSREAQAAVPGTPAVEAVEAVPGSPARSPSSMAAGLVLSMDGFAFGGSYMVHDSDNMVDDVTTFDLGARYGEGAWAVSLTYGNKSGGENDVDNNLYRLSTTYGLGAGVSVIGVLGMNEIQHGKGDKMTTGQDSSFLGTALAVSF